MTDTCLLEQRSQSAEASHILLVLAVCCVRLEETGPAESDVGVGRTQELGRRLADAEEAEEKNANDEEGEAGNRDGYMDGSRCRFPIMEISLGKNSNWSRGWRIGKC